MEICRIKLVDINYIMLMGESFSPKIASKNIAGNLIKTISP